MADEEKPKVFSGARAVFKFEGEAFNFGPQPQHWFGPSLDEMGEHYGLRRSMGENDASLRKRVMASLQQQNVEIKNEFDGLLDSQLLESVQGGSQITHPELPSCKPTYDWWTTTPPELPPPPAPPEAPPHDPRPSSHRNAQGVEVRCPWCESGKVEAEFVDVGVGHQQVTGHLCHTCGAYELGHNVDTTSITEAEQKVGWSGPDPRYLWDGWEDCVDSRCMTDHVCDTCKLKLWGA